MRGNQPSILQLILLLIASTTLLIVSARDTFSEAERTEKSWLSIAQSKAIAEEKFIYGLPIVMNYAVMYEYAVDGNRQQQTEIVLMISKGRKTAADTARVFGVHPATISRLLSRARQH